MAAASLSVEELLGIAPGAQSPSVADRGGPSAVAVPAGGPHMIAGDAHDGASRQSTELARWQPSMGSADADIIPEKDIVDARSRDIMRNDAYMAGGDRIHRDNIVGSQYLLNSKPNSKVLFGKTDDKWEFEFQEEVEQKFTLWAESPLHWTDASRNGTFTSQVRLAVGVFLAAGENLSTAEWMPDDGRPFRTAVQVVDTARLSNPEDRTYDASRVRGGVEVDRRGAPQAYFIRMFNPGDNIYPSDGSMYSWRRVPIRKRWGRQMVLHSYEQNRPEQTRGISQMVRGLKESRMGKTFRGIVLENAIVNATYAASIESELPDQAFAAIGGEDSIDGVVTPWLEAIQSYSAGSKNLSIGGVKIPHLFPGTKLQLRPAGQGGPLGTEFEQSIMRYLAASLGVSYEQLSKDFTNTNYSGYRGAMNETRKFMAAQKKMAADAFANFVFRLWLEEAMNKGEIEAVKRQNIPNWYEGINAEAYCQCEWIGASQGQVDELKETQAAVLRMQNGLSTQEYEMARLNGGDWRAANRQMQREMVMRADLGIPPLVTDSTGMTNALQGTPAERGTKDGR
jgi:lambda family phage portal protein